MGYMKIPNLYKEQDILLFKECYCAEKIHGSSTHAKYKDGKLSFYAGGVPHDEFVKIFDEVELKKKFKELGYESIIVYGEGYGGKCQGMRDTYGDDLRFVAFEIKIGNSWLDIPNAEQVARGLGFDFVPYVKIPTTLEAIDAERDKPSVQAKKIGIKEDKQREGVVLRPLIEVTKNNGKRVIAKHKADDFRETRKKRTVKGREQLKVLTKAREIAQEWVTEMRLSHILDAFPDFSEKDIGAIIKAMQKDIEIEAEGEIEMNKAARKEIGKEIALMVKRRLQDKLHDEGA